MKRERNGSSPLPFLIRRSKTGPAVPLIFSTTDASGREGVVKRGGGRLRDFVIDETLLPSGFLKNISKRVEQIFEKN